MLATATQGIYLNIPQADYSLLSELVRKFGWQAQTREQMLDEFCASRPRVTNISEDDIMNEISAVRYQL